MKKGVPLYGRLLIWLTLNLLLVILVILIVIPGKLGVGWSLFLTSNVRERLQTIGETVAADLGGVLQDDWRVDLHRYNELYEVDFSVFDGTGRRLAGAEDQAVPLEVMQQLRRTPILMLPDMPLSSNAQRLSRSAMSPSPSKLLEMPGWPVPDRHVLMQNLFVIHPEGIERRYWIGVLSPIHAADGGLIPATIIASTPSFWRAFRLLDSHEWVDACFLILGLSLLLWLPLLWSITRSANRIIHTTERIADGHFDARVEPIRSDELGQIAEAVNTVAERLDSFLQSQKHFLANIAHEVASPLGRLQLGLEILERHVQDAEKTAFRDVHEEVQLMAELVSDLLAFSRVGIAEQSLQRNILSLHALTLSALHRENAGGAVLVTVPNQLQVRVDSTIFLRALGNLVRNALRYAGTAGGPIEVVAEASGKNVMIRVMDRGQGVPELALLKLGDAFYRPEAARRRETGGLGLGLATVKNCIAACGGTVTFKNREGGGFEAEIVMPRVTAIG